MSHTNSHRPFAWSAFYPISIRVDHDEVSDIDGHLRQYGLRVTRELPDFPDRSTNPRRRRTTLWPSPTPRRTMPHKFPVHKKHT